LYVLGGISCIALTLWGVGKAVSFGFYVMAIRTAVRIEQVPLTSFCRLEYNLQDQAKGFAEDLMPPAFSSFLAVCIASVG
jgi:hypothetical protein